MTFPVLIDRHGRGLVSASASRAGRTAWLNVRGIGGVMIERTKGSTIAGPWFLVERGDGEVKVWAGRISVLLTAARRL